MKLKNIKMKKILFFIIMALVFFTQKTKAQTGVPDTLVYLQNIVANKAQYIGQPFSLLNNSLQIEIKYFFPFGGIHYDMKKETHTSFAFYFPNNSDELYLTFPKIIVYWQTPLNMTLSDNIRGANRGRWDTSSVALYGNAIIKDITLRE